MRAKNTQKGGPEGTREVFGKTCMKIQTGMCTFRAKQNRERG